jgi:exonuclease SbcC
MIPRKLYMRNFMCYREQTLDLRGIHLACLTGSNGHGKSAILDALTWALWGRSRVGARRDDELIHLGQTEMEVEFEFDLLDNASSDDGETTDGGVRYRVIRKRSMRKRGQSSLELQGWDTVETKFRPLSEPTISQTQGRINDLLRMDYDTFINSAFLLQGRADEFTIKRPAERKRVLGDILGLEIYERYEKRAKEAAQERKSRGDQLLAAVEQVDRELAREPEYRTAVLEAEAELAQIQEERRETEVRYDEMRGKLQEAESAQQQFREVERRIATSQDEMSKLEQDLASHQARLTALEAALTKEAEIEQGFHAYQETVTENEAMNNKLAQSASLKEQRSDLERRIEAVRHELDMARHSAAEAVRQLEQEASALDQEPEWQEIQAALARMDERAAERERAQVEIQALSADGAALRADNTRAEKDAEQLKDKIALLSDTGESPEESAHCPLCGQPLSESDCSHLLSSFEEQLGVEREAYRQRNVQINENQRRINEYKATIAEIERELRQRTGWQRKEAALAHVVLEAREARDALPEAQDKLRAIRAELAGDAYAPEARAELLDVERQLAELGYEADAHRQIQAKLDELRPFDARMQTLREARSGVEPERLAIERLEQRRTEVERQLAEQQEKVAALQEVVEQIPALQRQALEARQVLERAHDREQQASLQLGAAQNKVEYCQDLKEQRVRRLEEERAIREEQAVYQELQRAFGKNGVQAMLIETAIPDIEQEANQLLARMTQGRMHVRFETQRDTKAGDTVETLDIHITDQLGTRSYETYSGGERYRINFAIRIALSKLLARRAGAQLQMLVIDEGFGTQDDEGREGVIDAIRAVEDDFACILVITHIEELKEKFNRHIEVEKTGEGSEITVI